jgi:isopentenyl-diphosphate delta-isomerase
LELALKAQHQAQGFSGLDAVHLSHDALPELNQSDIQIPKEVLFISGMTAGHTDALPLNRVLGRASASQGWILGMGSQRKALESEFRLWAELKSEYPNLKLIANLGLSQVIDASTESLLKLTKDTGALGLAVHLNALQEALQPEGTPNFKGGVEKLRELAGAFSSAGLKLIVKETGCGFSERTLKKLLPVEKAGLFALDVSGLGGTHWGRIEGARAGNTGGKIQEAASQTFQNWGESTVSSVKNAKAILKSTEVWASGGVRSGLDAAKLFALGATRVGFAKPALEAALKGEDTLIHWMNQVEFELKTALFCTGSKDLTELKNAL